jgi:transketolase
MRKQFVKTVESLMAKDERLVLLFGDIGVFGFRNAFKQYPERTYNIGICEQAMTSLAAGLSMEGLIPVLHSIAPFVVERCYEQLKIDLCYQHLPANIVSVGASYDYAALGCTHHCPGDISILHALPGMQIVIPGHPVEFDQLFNDAYANNNPTYYRLSERNNQKSNDVEFGRAKIIKHGSMATIISVGPTLDIVAQAVQDLDVSVLYYTTIVPFDDYTLLENCKSGKIVLVEPYYSGVMISDIHSALGKKPLAINCVGIPRKFLTDYGKVEEHDASIGLTSSNIRKQVEDIICA